MGQEPVHRQEPAGPGSPADHRPYRSPRRAEQAKATRQAVLDTALELFHIHGYAATTREAIARRAGVAPQTVGALGTKRALLEELLDRAARGDAGTPPPAVRSWPQELREQPDGAALLRHHARGSRRASERSGAVAAVVRGAAAADPGIAELWASLRLQRLRGQATVVELLAQVASLRPGLARGEAADILWMLTDDALHEGLVGERGWSGERFEAWLGEAMCAALLGHE